MNETQPSEYHQSRQEHASNEIIDQLNFRYRVCDLFTEAKKKKAPSGNDNDKLCECGFARSQHRRPSDGSAQKWTMANNTIEHIDPVYGYTLNQSLFVRLALDTHPQKVEKMLLDAWKIPKPRFIVSIVGGAKYFKWNDRLETNFINGIVDIAQKSDAWLLTSGYNVGIVQLVGQAISKVKLTNPEQKITAIGICKWGSVMNFERGTNSKKEKRKERTTDPSIHETKQRRSGEWELETNHSHYLMLDDGTIRKYDTKDYRTQLAVHMGRLQHEDDFTIPVVTIMVEGGKDTILNVYYDLRESVPVVLINGSGRAADLINRWLLYTKDLENDTKNRYNVYGIDEFAKMSSKHSSAEHNSGSSTASPNAVHMDARHRELADMFGKYKEYLEEDVTNTIPNKEDDENLVKYVMYCLQPAVRSDITVFNLNSDNDLPETILRSICRSRQKLSKRKEKERHDMAESNQGLGTVRSDKQKKIDSKSHLRVTRKSQNAERLRLLNLAMDWDCFDVAKELIFKNSLDNIMHKNLTFQSALQKNRPQFVYEFLKLKIDLNEIFLSTKDSSKKYQYKEFIKILYTHVKYDKTHLNHFIPIDKPLKKREIDSVETLNNTLTSLIGDYMHELYFDTLEKEDADRIYNGLKEEQKSLSNEVRKGIMRNYFLHNYFLRDLFIWAILMNYMDMAKVFLSHMKYRICPALIATKILKQYHRKAPYGDLKEGYKKSAQYFEDYAVNCLDKCDDHDAAKACEIILQRNELYGYVTCVQVAADAEDKKFLATQCCVEAMNNVWYDKLHPDQSTLGDKASLLVGVVSLGLIAPGLVSYRKMPENVKSVDPSDLLVRTNGIDYIDSALLEYPVRPPSHPAYQRYFPKLAKFHQSSPIKFYYHVITYCFFLLLFSYVLLFNFSPPTDQIPSIHWTEILTIMLVSCMLIEEIRLFFSQDNLTFVGRFGNYFGQLLKQLTFIGFILFYIGLIVRFTHGNSEDDFIAARVIMAIDIELWWLRSLSFIIVIPTLGPHLVSIGKMLKDLLFFMCIIAIVMAGYGVASRAMVYYPVANGFTTATGGPIDASFDGRSVFRQIVYPVYYMMYGEFSDELTNLDSNPDAGWSVATHVLLAIHMLLVNILLINMLIAMFSKRFQQVSDDTQNIWHSQKYVFTREYFTRAPFFPPISLGYDIYYLCRMSYFYIKRAFFHKPADYGARVFQIIATNIETTEGWCEFEETSTYEYAHSEARALTKENEKKDDSSSKDKSKSKSTSGTDARNKGTREAIADTENDANSTIDGLKEISDEMIKLNTIIEQMRGDLKPKNTITQPAKKSEKKQ